jgi:tetratricopeptide (TPR) repeat protein
MLNDVLSRCKLSSRLFYGNAEKFFGIINKEVVKMQRNLLKKEATIFTKSNVKILVAVIVGVLFVVAGVFIHYSRIRRIDNLASDSLGKALSLYFEDSNRQADDTLFELLDEVITKYPKTPAGELAKLFKAHALIRLKAYDKALSVLEDLEKNSNVVAVKPLAGQEVIYVYDSKKDFPNAITASKKFIDKYPDDLRIKDVYLNLAEYYAASGLQDEAVKTFNEIVINFPATQEAEKAQKRLNEIK